jgi:hypothetical protein
VRTEPLHGPVEGAQERPGGHRRVGLGELAAPDANRDQPPDDALVSVAPGDDCRAAPGRQRVELEVRRRPLHVLDQATHVLGGQGAQANGDRPLAVPGSGGVGEEPIEGAVLTEVEDLVLAGEVVVEVGGGEVRSHRDLPHAGGGKSHLLKDARGGGKDLRAPRLGSPLPTPLLRTAVRSSNHCSIVGDGRPEGQGEPAAAVRHL